MKMKRTILIGVISGALLLPSTSLAANNTGFASDSASQQQTQSLKQSQTIQTTNKQVNGNVTPITTPTSDYVNNTNKIDISKLQDTEFYNSITDGIQTISFSSHMSKG
jgi:hypothetical protein